MIAHPDFEALKEPERRKFDFLHVQVKPQKNPEQALFKIGWDLEEKVHDDWLAGITTHTAIKEEMRTLAHREAAYACLDGTSVGEFRVKEGTRTLAEYRQDKLCICDGTCSCSRVCTRFPDMHCPCSSKLTLMVDLPPLEASDDAMSVDDSKCDEESE